MISSFTAFLSIVNKVINKLFYFFLSIFFLKYSVSDYALLILYFLLCGYMSELYSLSIPKLFNNFYHKYNHRTFLSSVIFSLYVCIILFLIFCIIFYAGKNILKTNEYHLSYLFIFSFLIGGLASSIDDIVDRYSFLNFKHSNIYIFDILKILLITIVGTFYLYYFQMLKIINFLLIYSLIMIFFSFIKFFTFLGKINLNFFFNIENIKIIEFRKTLSLLLSIFLISMFIMGQFSFSRILIIHFESLELFASFSFHYQLVEICSLFFLVITQIFTPAIVHSTKLERTKKLRVLQDKILIFFLLFPPIIFLLINFVTKNIIQVLNSEIIYNLVLSIILSLSLYSTFFYMIFYQYILILKKEIFFLKTIIFGFLINLILSVFLVKYFSISGVATANLLSNILIFIILNSKLSFFFFRKRTIFPATFFFIRLSILIIFLIFIPIRDIFDSAFMNLIKDFTYFVFLLIITEFFMKKKYRILTTYFNLVKVLNINIKKTKNNF